MLIPEASSFSSLVDFFSFAAWLFYGGTFASLLWLRYKKPNLNRPYKVSFLSECTKKHKAYVFWWFDQHFWDKILTNKDLCCTILTSVIAASSCYVRAASSHWSRSGKQFWNVAINWKKHKCSNLIETENVSCFMFHVSFRKHWEKENHLFISFIKL